MKIIRKWNLNKLFFVTIWSYGLSSNTEEYLILSWCQTLSNIWGVGFCENSYRPLTIFTKRSILDLWRDFEYVSDIDPAGWTVIMLEGYSVHCPTSKMDVFTKMVKGLQLLSIFAKNLHLRLSAGLYIRLRM